MIKSLNAEEFKAVPWLETSALMMSHPKGILFSEKKPNVIVGPNGSGKSALLTSLALQTLSFFTGESSFDDNFVRSRDCEDFWTKERSWSTQFTFLKGLKCNTDNAPALYYRPGHVPGNEKGITTAMMCGYFDEAKVYAKLVKNKSSGQQSQALLQKIQSVLDGSAPDLAFKYVNWRAGKEPRTLDVGRHFSDFEYQAEVLKNLYGSPKADVKSLLLMDEPEQSLDARAEALLWRQIAEVDTSRVQVIVATHSLYPLLHPKAFSLIEAVPGYIKEVQNLLEPTYEHS